MRGRKAAALDAAGAAMGPLGLLTFAFLAWKLIAEIPSWAALRCYCGLVGCVIPGLETMAIRLKQDRSKNWSELADAEDFLDRRGTPRSDLPHDLLFWPLLTASSPIMRALWCEQKALPSLFEWTVPDYLGLR